MGNKVAKCYILLLYITTRYNGTIFILCLILGVLHSLKQIIKGTQKSEILVGQVGFKLWIKTVKILFWSITHKLFGLLKFQCYF